jgi:hypothetical protein
VAALLLLLLLLLLRQCVASHLKQPPQQLGTGWPPLRAASCHLPQAMASQPFGRHAICQRQQGWRQRDAAAADAAAPALLLFAGSCCARVRVHAAGLALVAAADWCCEARQPHASAEHYAAAARHVRHLVAAACCLPSLAFGYLGGRPQRHCQRCGAATAYDDQPGCSDCTRVIRVTQMLLGNQTAGQCHD